MSLQLAYVIVGKIHLLETGMYVTLRVREQRPKTEREIERKDKMITFIKYFFLFWANGYYVVYTWKVPLRMLSIWLSCSSMRFILFKKWNELSGMDLILLLLKSRYCRLVRDLNDLCGISDMDFDSPWDIFKVNSEWPTFEVIR